MQLSVLLTPKVSKDQIEGWAEDTDGTQRLKVRVTAVPENGKANAVLIKLLSKKLKLSKSKITIVRGETSRQKTLEIEGVETRNGGDILPLPYVSLTKSVSPPG